MPKRIVVSVGTVLAVLAFWPVTASAHSFGQVYTLPVPFWLYASGATVALLASFVVVGIFAGHESTVQTPSSSDLYATRWLQTVKRCQLLTLLKLLSAASLLLCMATGFWGVKSPYMNFNMTFFWIVFVLGFAYSTAIVGNVWASINPWRNLAWAFGLLWSRFRNGFFQYPKWLGYWPGLLLYMGFIWLELFGKTTPFSLASWLLAYSVFNLFGCLVFGTRAWFRYVELFSIFLRLVAKMAPLSYRSGNDGQAPRLQLHWPFAGLMQGRAESMSLLLFILFMLSSTAYDGLHEAKPWVEWFWVQLYPQYLVDYVGRNPFKAFPVLREIYFYWQSAWLLLSPFIYLAVYWLFIWLAKLAASSTLSVRELALRFAYSLLPIALVYHITHYYTLIETQGVKITALASDPFGRGWDLFGTADWYQRTIIPDTNIVWHVQVALIVIGHIVSVYIAHLEAVRTFPTRRQALFSQLPMLVLMVLFTTAGLWILSQPIKLSS